MIYMKKEILDPIIYNPFEDVYSPSDDSYMILDFIRENLSKEFFDEIPINTIKNILDLGTGTGIIAIFLRLLNAFSAQVYASDVLKNAIHCAQKNEKINKIENKHRVRFSAKFLDRDSKVIETSKNKKFKQTQLS